jgi:DNA-binding transcriptional MocR family regulator
MPSPREHNKGHDKSLSKGLNAFPTIAAEAALSFLKDTKGALTWTTRDVAGTLKIDRREAEQALALLQAQGYVQPAPGAKGKWITTPAGETVSGAKAPRFARDSVEQSLAELKGRIQRNNKNRQTPFRITDAVAFGDFLLRDRARVQSADVGISLVRRQDSPHRGNSANVTHSASEAQAERKFLRELRAKSAHLNLRPYSDWMRSRTHRDLL